MTGRNWTELFFLDEATAFAAGHRPCGYCRRAAYRRFVDAWETTQGDRPSAKDMDKALHPARVRRDRSQVRFDASLGELPDGTFVWRDGGAHLIWQDHLHQYTPEKYRVATSYDPAEIVSVLTPMPIVAVLTAGYAPQIAL
jgi:hypothetical protein